MTDLLNNFYVAGGAAQVLSMPHDECWSFLWIGYNDIIGGGSPMMTYTNISTFILQKVHALGCKVMLANEIEYPSGQSVSLTTQGLILANTAGADIIANFATDPVWLGGSGGTYGYTSQTFASYPHPTTFGYGYVATIYANAINPFFKWIVFWQGSSKHKTILCMKWFRRASEYHHDGGAIDYMRGGNLNQKRFDSRIWMGQFPETNRQLHRFV